MKSFGPGFIESQQISQRLLQTIRILGENKGKQDLYKRQVPQVLENLKNAAIIQSVESSNRIEGVTAPPEIIKALVLQKTSPHNRSEQEIAGYRDVLNTIHANYEHMPFTPGLVLQLHRDLFQFVPGQGGSWKSSDNEITEKLANGSTFVRFKPLQAHLTGEAMEHLHRQFSRIWDEQSIEPLLLIATYILDFLCIHPFLDGNGRMARLLTLLLFYKAGYEVGRYISLEMLVERTKDGYYESLYNSSAGWHEGRHSIVPWWEYLLGVVLYKAYREFEDRIGLLSTAHGAKTEMVFECVKRMPQRFKYHEVAAVCPHISDATIRRVLRSLRDNGHITCIKEGRDATWEKLDHDPVN